MHQELDPYNLIFERRRRKCAEIQKSRREQLLNKSRNLIKTESTSIDPQKWPQEEVESSYLIQNPTSQQLEHVQLTQGFQGMSFSNKITLQSPPGQVRKAKKTAVPNSRRYAKLLQVPSWMNNVPELLQQFYAMARPSGRSCLLVFDRGWFYLYDKTGKKISLSVDKSKQANTAATIKLCHNMQGSLLQVVYCGKEQLIFIVDLISWKGNIMTTENFQFRHSWLLANMANTPANTKLLSASLRLVQYRQLISRAELEQMYLGDFGYVKQGLCFVHKQSAYVHGVNENVFIWKDSHTSLYPVDRDKGNHSQQMAEQSPDYIYGIARLLKDGAVKTLDGFQLSRVENMPKEHPFGCFVKFRLTGVEFNQSLGSQHQILENNLTGSLSVGLSNFQIAQYGVPYRVRADTFSRIVFQHRVRHDPLSIQQIAARLSA